MKYRIQPRWNPVRDSYTNFRYTEVYEIQFWDWWTLGWEYLETWADEGMAVLRLRQLTGPDRPRSRIRARAARMAEQMRAIALQAKRLIGGSPKA